MILSNQSFSWLDLTPNQWEIDKVKDHFYFSDIQTENFDNYPVLSLTMTGVKKRNMDTNKGQLPESYEKYNLVDSSCLVFNPMDLISGWVDVPKTEGLISPSYRTIKLRSDKTNLNFIKYYFQSLYKEKVLFHFGEGVHYEYRWGLGKETLKNFPIPIPPKEEQNQIVSYLDKKVHQTDELIKKIEQKIELLKEQRNSLINEVVTQGLNPNVEMRNSGIEWIGEIPSHYQMIPIKFLVTTPVSDGPHETPQFIDGGGIPFLSVEGVVGNKIDFKKVRGYISKELHEQYSKKCKPIRNDVLLVKSGSTTGKSTIVETDLEFNIWSPLCVIRSDTNKIIPRFTFQTFQSGYFQLLIENNWSYGTQPNIGMGVIENLRIVVPPLSEQQQIVEYLDEKTQLIERTISIEEKRTKLLKEYKQSLIFEVVTGKKRVVG